MIIDKKIQRFSIFEDSTIRYGLERITQNRAGIVFIVDEHNHLKGLFTNGDFMRWLVKQDVVNLDRSVASVMKREFIFATEDDTPETIADSLKQVLFVPIIDAQNHLVAVARQRDPEVQIGDFHLAADSPTFIIAEIGINHNGSLERALQLIEAAALSGADCAKFQMRDLASLYVNAGNADDASENLGSQYTLDLLTRFELTPDEMYQAFDHCKAHGLLPLCTPWDLKSLERLEAYGLPGYKVASADMTNHELLATMAQAGTPMICSTGMSDEAEIKQSVDLLQRVGAQYILLQCNSTYPAPFKDVNLRYLPRLAELGDCFVGYSGHERGYHVAVTAVAMGAKVIEKHFTFDRTMEGNDHKVSLLPDEFAEMVTAIRQVEEALGSDEPRQITQGERMNRVNLSKSLIARTPIRQNEIIKRDMLTIKSPGRGLQPNYLTQLLGRPASRDMQPGDFFFLTDLTDEVPQARAYHFRRPWGVPVRYHDYRQLMQGVPPDLLEFHLSYKDMEANLEDYFDEPLEPGFVVHAPELFARDHTLDLCAENEDYRRHSILELQRVIDITRQLKPYFPSTTSPMIIVNIGGFTELNPLPEYVRQDLYDRLGDSLMQLDTTGIELIPQTMPPFPWHFGGQRYHNLFIKADEIVAFCKAHQVRICLDVSHSKLACNHFGWSFKEFVDCVGPYTAHLHIVDAEGVDSEGLQIGEGDIDFAALAEQLDHVAPEVSFIPEIWQGHENNGEGFWTALERLEQWF